MGIPLYLAMTAAEMEEKTVLPKEIAWMACQFSPYGTSLSNLPHTLPSEAILMLNDLTPIHGHDPQQILDQLAYCIERFHCRAVILDFQRRENPETKALVTALCALSCPLVISEAYARKDRAVLLPPAPLSTPLEEYLSPWKQQEVWLELALDGEILAITEQGTTTTPLPYPELNQTGFLEKSLNCHYRTQVTENQAEFTLWRTEEDLQNLHKTAETLGVTATVGLYQELKHIFIESCS